MNVAGLSPDISAPMQNQCGINNMATSNLMTKTVSRKLLKICTTLSILRTLSGVQLGEDFLNIHLEPQ